MLYTMIIRTSMNKMHTVEFANRLMRNSMVQSVVTNEIDGCESLIVKLVCGGYFKPVQYDLDYYEEYIEEIRFEKDQG